MTLVEIANVVELVGVIVGALAAGGVVGASKVFRRFVGEAVREAVSEEVAGAVRKHVEPIARDVRQLRREVVELRALVPLEGGA